MDSAELFVIVIILLSIVTVLFLSIIIFLFYLKGKVKKLMDALADTNKLFNWIKDKL